MRIPLKYNFRNLARRKVRTAMTIAGIALVIAVGVFMLAFIRGILHMAKDAGSPDNILVLDRKAATQELSSVRVEDYNHLRALPRIKKDASGRPLISPEVVQQCEVSTATRKDRPGVARGVTPAVFEVNDKLRMVEGLRPGEGGGAWEICVGELTAASLGVSSDELAVGKTLEFQDRTWTIVGRFSAGRTALDSEILARIEDVFSAFNRRGSYSMVVLKLDDIGDMAPMVESLNARNDIQVKAVPEVEYYRALVDGFTQVISLAVFMALVAALGGLVSGMNTMFASVTGRIREIGTLKVLGFSGGDVVAAVLMESLCIALVGGLIGCALGFTINGLPTKIFMGAFALRVDAFAVAGGMGLAAVIGVIGALPPALRGGRMNIVDALKAC